MRKKSEFHSKKIANKKTDKKTGIKTIKNTESKAIKGTTFSNQNIKTDLKSFYDHEAKKYSETRKKFRQEENIILNELNPIFEESKKNNKKVRILEFGCGSGRFATLLNQKLPNQFDYVGIDLSEELLSYARQDNPNLTFLPGDITKCIKNFGQESFDLIVGTSSFQHIPTFQERSFLMKNFYRILNYDGTVLMTNWSLSSWFIKKNWKSVLKSFFKSLIQFNIKTNRNILVPRTNKNGKTYNRFYHFFSLEELQKLAIFSGFSIKTLSFLDEKGNFCDNEKKSRSSILVTKKTPIE